MTDTPATTTTTPPSLPAPTPAPFNLPSIGTDVVLMLTGLGAVFYAKVIKPQLKKRLERSMRLAASSYSEIENALAETLGHSKSDRVVLYELHNGEILAGGQHFIKVSITNEYPRPGYADIRSHVSSAPFSQVSKHFDYMHKNGHMQVLSPIEIQEGASSRQERLLLALGVNACVQYLLTNENDSPIGMLELHYGDASKVIKNPQELWPIAQRINNLIMPQSQPFIDVLLSMLK